MRKKNTNCYKNCSRCNGLYGTGNLGEELMFGEPADACIEVYDTEYNLCPDCTRQLHSFLINDNSFNSNAIKLDAYKEMAEELKEHHTSFRHATMGNFVNVEAIDDFIKSKQEELLDDKKTE